MVSEIQPQGLLYPSFCNIQNFDRKKNNNCLQIKNFESKIQKIKTKKNVCFLHMSLNSRKSKINQSWKYIAIIELPVTLIAAQGTRPRKQLKKRYHWKNV